MILTGVTPAEDIATGNALFTDPWKYLSNLKPAALSAVYQVIIILLIFFIGRKIIQLVTKASDRALKKIPGEETGIRHFTVSLIRALLYIAMILIIAARLGISSTSLAAVVASAGLALGLALQGSLQNFAGGVLILTMKPFSTGDYISFSSGEGTVRTIGLVYTVIRTRDNRIITVPNGSLSNGTITNMTGLPERLLSIPVSVSYDTDTDRAREIMTEIFRNSPGIKKEKPVQVRLTSLDDSSMVLTASGWTGGNDHEAYLKLQCDLREEIKKKFDGNGISIPYPQMDVHMK